MMLTPYLNKCFQMLLLDGYMPLYAVQSDSAVFDSEWHLIWDCGQFSSLRTMCLEFSRGLSSIRESSQVADYSSDIDLRSLIRLIREDSTLDSTPKPSRD